MESRFDLKTALATWRQFQVRRQGFLTEDLDELEVHLRAHMAELRHQGMSDEAAFREAVRALGDLADAEPAYRRVYWGKLRRRSQVMDELRSRATMLGNYLKIALRTLRRQKGYSFINIAGLTLGMACCLLLFQYVAFETNFDAFNTKKDRLYRATFGYTRGDGQEGVSATSVLAFGPTMAEHVPGILRYARILPTYGGVVLSDPGASDSRSLTEERALFVDTTFLSLFDYALVEGDRSQALRQPHTMLISASMARTYFGDEDPLGKTLELAWWESGTYTVAGVLEDVPPTSHLQFDVLFPLNDLLNNASFEGRDAAWGNAFYVTYLEVDEAADLAALEERISASYDRYRPGGVPEGMETRARLQPLADIHLNRAIAAPATRTTDSRLVYFFALIALMTLVIALVNYVNLATARAMNRAREVGVRKVVGAYRRQLVGQFMLESALTNLVALVLAIALALLLLPAVNRVAGVEMILDLWRDARFWAGFLTLFGVGALLSALYPALILSSFKPATVLKGQAGAFASRLGLRKALVVLQFTASIAMLAGTTIVYLQLAYLRGMDTGLDLDQVLVVEGPQAREEDSSRPAEMNALKHELRQIPAVQEIGMSSTTPGRGVDMVYGRTARVSDDPGAGALVLGTSIDADFPDVYGLQLVAGAPFYPGMAVPESGDEPVLVNETLVRTFGYPSNEDAVGGRLRALDRVFVVQGVFRDFQWSSAHEARAPMVFQYDPGACRISVKIGMQDLPGTLADIEKAYTSIFPGTPFRYTFADAAFDEQYRADRRFAALFAGFTGIAVVIACLGLFGLASFTAQQRTREIGVRKVLGASVPNIIALLSADFLKLVALAFALASPLAYFVMRRWLDEFAYRIDIGPGVFVLTGGLVALIAVLTVSYQSVRAALADPVTSLWRV